MGPVPAIVIHPVIRPVIGSIICAINGLAVCITRDVPTPAPL